MRRLKIEPRAGWQARLEKIGFLFHTAEETYWNESACYELSIEDASLVEKSTNDLHELCVEAVQVVIDRDWFPRMKISWQQAQMITDSWNKNELSIYGRFDLAGDLSTPPKMLEYNADTPTALFEAAVVQWFWLEDMFPELDQLNSIHSRLISRWPQIADKSLPLYFTSMRDQVEDLTQTEYLRDVAQQAGFKTEFIFLEDIGWDRSRNRFVDLENKPVQQCFKLYPWEWLLRDSFGRELKASGLKLIEPAWKALLSNKAILPLLWELYPDHPNLLPAYFEKPLTGMYVEKPFLSREGARITIFEDGRTISSSTAGAEESPYFVYQAYAPLAQFDQRSCVIGSWIIGEEAAGIGLREDRAEITTNKSQFVPHYINSRRSIQ